MLSSRPPQDPQMAEWKMAMAEYPDTRGRIDTPSLALAWAEAPWDSAVFGFTVLQIHEMEVRGPQAQGDMATFEADRDLLAAGLVSCRLPCGNLRESMLLEARGFRFVEMLYQPELGDLQENVRQDEPSLTIAPATVADMPAIEAIAGNAFRNERFHVDPRLDSARGDYRYRNWVRSAFDHPRQQLYAVRDGKRLVAFFVTELQADGTCYWHLNAVAPEIQGRGYGRRAWMAMLGEAHRIGAVRVRTAIVARNHRVLNLYARLGFRFPSPLMTFHWVRGTGHD